MNTISPQLIDEVRGLLQASLTDVFSTMLVMEAQPTEFQELKKDDDVFVAASVGFVGDVHGIVYIYLKAPFARTIASRMLSMEEADLTEDEIIDDTIGELGNMIVGATKSRLCDDDVTCTLTIPTVIRGRGLSVASPCTSETQRMTIACEGQLIMLELIMKPSPQP